MKSGVDSQPNDAGTSSIGPPDWFLKRRARLAESNASGLNRGTPAPSDPLQVESIPGQSPPGSFAAAPLVTGQLVTGQQPQQSTADSGSDSEFVVRSVAESGVDSEQGPFVSVHASPPPLPRRSASKNAAGAAQSIETRAAGHPIAPRTTPAIDPLPTVASIVPPIQVAEEPSDDEDPSFFQYFTARRLGKLALGSYAISLLVHILIATPLAAIIFHQELQQVAMTTLMAISDGDDDDGGLDDTVLMVDPPGGKSVELEDDFFTPKSMASNDTLTAGVFAEELRSSATKKGEGEGTGSGIGDGLNLGGFQMPEGGKAVQKGSFTVWTVPDDPAPFEDYLIIIQVKYKKPGQRIIKTDVSGSVRGTDNFRLSISEYTSKIVPEANQVVVRIPGASVKVKDTINVHSALLRESQKLTITF